ncbi:SpaA isopeptide-forming pilin-related protein, partial [Anthropogastromicrobium sp.]|uniref:LPXTG cell wall anchor domain-containing protein n=1 Tax=Anthropogastromicrobium sp. TaxID=2981649 RepID=UPI00307B978B
LSNETVTKFEWKGLDDGDYMLTEVITPAGYNTIAPIKFTVNADHNITWEGENRNTILTSLTGNAATGDITFTANDDKTELATNVVNNKGSELPSTGGMGTTIFYVVGSILVLGAAILLITKKRMSAR